MQPIMFVLLFSYVFGGSIEVPGYDSYNQYLMPGIFAQTVVFGSVVHRRRPGRGHAEGLHRPAALAADLPVGACSIGRTISDLVRNVRHVRGHARRRRSPSASASRAACGAGVAGHAAAALLQLRVQLDPGADRLSVKSVEAANSAGFIWMFPLTFVSSAFVDTSTMPDWLQPIADANPFTMATNAARALYNGQDPGQRPSG